MRVGGRLHTMVKPTDITTHDGKLVDWLTHYALLVMEDRLGYPLTVVQGHHVGTAASANTHDGWGVVDLAPWDWRNKCRVGRDIGFWFWHRLPSQGPWNEHNHGNLAADEKRMSSAAKRQMDQARAGTNGLKNHGRDPQAGPRPIPMLPWPGSAAALALQKKIRDREAGRDNPPIDDHQTTDERLGADWSFSEPNLVATAEVYDFVVRYISNGSDKDITPDEVKRLHARKLYILLVWETTAARAGQGAAAGAEDRKRAEAKARALGYPQGCPIFYAVDQDLTADKVRPYFTAVKEGATWEVGSYGGVKIAYGRVAPWRWQTGAWSAGKLSKYAHLYQRIHPTKRIAGAAAGSWDENVLLAGIPMWGPNGLAVVSPSTVQEDDMGYKDWSQADKDAMIQDILNAPITNLNPDGSERKSTLANMIRNIEVGNERQLTAVLNKLQEAIDAGK